MKITDYAIFTGDDPGELVTDIAEALKDGWQPFGGIAMHPNAECGTYAQALVKYRKDPDN